MSKLLFQKLVERINCTYGPEFDDAVTHKGRTEIISLHKVLPVYNDKTIYFEKREMMSTFQLIQ